MIKLSKQDHSLTQGYKPSHPQQAYPRHTYTSGGSGWIFQSIENLFLKVDRFNPLKGEGYINLPAVIKSTKTVINVKNKDNKCFEYAILSALHHNEVDQKQTNSPSQYKKDLGKLNFTDIEFPVSLKDMDKFEKNNPDMKVNVFGYERSVQILRLDKTDPQNAIDLLFITNEENPHYCWIKNFSRLVSSQVSKQSRIIFLQKMFEQIYSARKLEEHIEICKEISACKIEVPKPGETITFKNFNKSMRVPFVICADFEAITERIDSATPNREKSYNEKYQKHTPSGFCYYVKCEGEENYAEPVVYRGKDCVQKFCEMIEEEVKEIADIYKNIISLEMTAEDNEKFQSAVDCHICNKKLNNNKTILFKKDPIHKSCLPKEYKDATEFSLRCVMERDDWKKYFKKSNCAICKDPLTGETVRDHDHLTG